MERENKPDYGYSHVRGYNKMNKETLLFSDLSLHMNGEGKRGEGALVGKVRSAKCQDFQFDSLNNNNNNNLCLNLGSFNTFPYIHFHWEPLEEPWYVLKGLWSKFSSRVVILHSENSENVSELGCPQSFMLTRLKQDHKTVK